jgi:NTP pyrophosphatase (non-canonical NTP hydrolase)
MGISAFGRGMADLETIQKKILSFRNERDWAQFHDPKNLAEALSIEAGELLENFLWKTTEQSRNLTAEELKNVKEELADIFIFLTYLSEEYKIDLLSEVEKKIGVNAAKYPVEQAKGSAKKYKTFEYNK